MSAIRQRTIQVDGQKVTIKSRNRSNVGNFCGFHVWINGGNKSIERMHVNRLFRDEAEDFALARWKQLNGMV
jgi:hypothetical protein